MCVFMYVKKTKENVITFLSTQMSLLVGSPRHINFHIYKIGKFWEMNTIECTKKERKEILYKTSCYIFNGLPLAVTTSWLSLS